MIERESTIISTAEQKLKESEEHFRILAENLPNMLFINVEGRVVYTNDRAVKILGYSKKYIYSDKFNFLAVTAPESREIVRQNFKLHMSGQEVEPYEYGLITKNGSVLKTMLYSKLITYKGKRAILGTVVDITKQKQAEQYLKEQEQRKDEFITVASHELKTPITSIKLYNQILMERAKKPDQLLVKMHEQVERLTGLVDQLLDVSKIQAGNIQIVHERFSLSRLISDIIYIIRALSPSHVVEFENKGVTTVYADKGRLEQVLINLLTNAVKYSAERKKILIRAKKNKHEIVIMVKDAGLGIEEKYLDKIFDRFYRTSNTDKTKLPGLGMGLYISREIIHLHKGKMWAKSKIGKGSSFYFTLPIK